MEKKIKDIKINTPTIVIVVIVSLLIAGFFVYQNIIKLKIDLEKGNESADNLMTLSKKMSDVAQEMIDNPERFTPWGTYKENY